MHRPAQPRPKLLSVVRGTFRWFTGFPAHPSELDHPDTSRAAERVMPMFAWRIVCVLAVGLSGGIALAEPDQRSKNPSPLLIAAEGTSQEGSQSVGERIAQWLKTCLEDWDAATHMTRNEWRTTCERVSQERGKFLRENPSSKPAIGDTLP